MRTFTVILLVCCVVSAHAASTVASWYGKKIHHKTASGEAFNSRALTAASLRYPLGTLLKVTNLKNHCSVVVRVNDRGPLSGHRGLDLTERAAELLGFKHNGLARVSVEVLH